MCANLTNPTPIGAARDHGPATAGMSSEHGPLPAARGCDAIPVTTLGLLAKHGPLRAARDRGPAATTRLRWTCGLNNSTGGQRQIACS